MTNINESQKINKIHLTSSQKMVLSKITASANAVVASEQARGNANLTSAQNLLIKLGLLRVDDEGVHITDKGNSAMKDENIVDSSGSLTDVGKSLSGAKDLSDLNKGNDNEEPTAPDIDGDGKGDAPLTDSPVGESFQLFKRVALMADAKRLHSSS